MKITKYGHCCLLVDTGGGRVLIDPGTFSAGFEQVDGLAAVLLTHAHPDHVDTARLPGLLERNPGATVVADEQTAQQLSGTPAAGGRTVRAVAAGDRLSLGGIDTEVIGSEHAVIYPDLPTISNVGYLLDGRLFYPGDAFTAPGREIEILALPTAAPWLKVSEGIDYLRAVRPRLALPVHEGAAARPQMYYTLFEQFADPGTTVRVLGPGETLDA